MLFELLGKFRRYVTHALLIGVIFAGASILHATPVSAAAGINQQLNFQGRLLNAQGATAPDGYYNVEFKIYQDGTGAAGNPGGTLKWTEDWLNTNGNGVRVVNGYISVQLGAVNPFGSSIDWNQDTLWLSVNIGTTNTTCTPFTSCGGDGEMVPMKRLSAVPYALNAANLGGLSAAGFVQNTTTLQTGTNMTIDGTARADTSVLTPLIDTNTNVALNIGTTNASAINLNQSVTVAADKSLTLTGGTTASRPASPTEGMLWYDTDTKQLLTYANGKWQGDRTTSTKIVAASNSSQAEKDAADYVATGTGDQTQINAALTAAAGGKVYLMEGTYTINAGISVPNNTTLAGSGTGTVITIPNSFNAAINAITNTTTGGSGTGVTIQDLLLDGNKANQTGGAMVGIKFNGVGSGSGTSAIKGGKIANVQSNNWYGGSSQGINLISSSNNSITGNSASGNGNIGIIVSGGSNNAIIGNIVQGNSGLTSLFISSSSNNTVSGNIVQGNTTDGIDLWSGSGNTVSGNIISGNQSTGIYVYTETGDTISANTVVGSSADGIYLQSTQNSLITGNGLKDNTGAQLRVATGSANNTLSSNAISGSGTHSITIDSGASTTYLAGNTLGSGAITDSGTGTVYGGQVNASGNFLIQPAGTIELLKDTNVTGTLSATTALHAPSVDTASAGTLSIGETNATTINIGTNAAAHTINVGTGAAAQTVTVGSTNSTSGTTIQAADGGLNLNTVGGGFVYVNVSGAQKLNITTSQIIGRSDGYAFRDGAGNDFLSMDNTTGKVSIAYNRQLDVAGTANFAKGLTIDGAGSGGALTYTTPGGASLKTAINITNYNQSAFSTLLALGVTAGADTTARGILVADGRTSAHQATIGILSPDENQIGGLNYNGSNTALSLANTASTIILQGGGANLLAATLNGTDATTTLGVAGTNAGKLVLTTDGGNTNTVTLLSAAQSGSYTLTVPILGANDTICTATLANCANGTMFIQNTTTQQASSNFNISGAGVAASLQATNLIGTYLDAPNSSTAITVGTTASSIDLKQNATLATGKTLTLIGDTRANITSIASPTEGMMTYDTTNHQLLVYANGKWQADRTNATLVAASDSTQAAKDAADYVGDGNTAAAGDGDQVQINQALADADPAGTGRKTGKVYLFPGTYTVDAPVSVPNNTTLAGAGRGTVITVANSFSTSINTVTNTTTGGSGTGIVIQDFRLEGNATTQTAGTMYGIYFNGVGSGTGSSAVQGGKISNVWTNNWRNSGIYLQASSNNTITNSVSQGNTEYGVVASASSNNTVTSNTTQGNTIAGIYLATGSGNTISANTAQGNTGTGISLNTSLNNTITGNTTEGNGGNGITLSGVTGSTISGNTIQGNTSYGLYLATGSNNTVTGNNIQANASIGLYLNASSTNLISANRLIDNGGATVNNAIYLSASDSNTITGNSITDASATSNNYAINIINSTSDTNYLSSNTLGTGSINDAGTGTIYGGQLNAAGNFVIQPAGTVELQKNTNVTGTLAASTSVLTPSLDRSAPGTLSIGTNATNSTAITIGNATATTTIAGNTSVTLNATTATGMVCRNTGNGILSACDATILTPTASNFILNTSTQQTGNFNINGTGVAGTLQATSLIGTSLDTATGVALNIGAAGAPVTTAINLNQNVVVATTKTLRIAGDTRANITSIASPTEGMMTYDTTNHQLLVYANGKWQADRTTSTKIVAASNSSQAEKDAADYVATGTGDQAQINAALTAAAGGKVYLMEGTYTINGTVSIPNNTALAGAGAGTIITIPNSLNSAFNAISNTTGGGSGTGLTVQDLTIDGNGTNQTSGDMNGFYFNGLGSGTGSSAISGVKIMNIRDKNWTSSSASHGILFNTSFNSTVTSSTFTSNNVAVELDYSSNIIVSNNDVEGGNYGIGSWASPSNTITNNTIAGVAVRGIDIASTSDNDIITGNNLINNAVGFQVASTNTTFANNNVQGNTSYGIYADGASKNNFSGNKFFDNGGTADNNALYFGNTSSNNSITGNSFDDTSATSTNVAIKINDAGSSANYLANNTLGSASVSDAGTGTIYGGQVNAAGNFAIQPAGTVELQKNTNVTGTLTASVSVLTPSIDRSSAGTLTIGTNATNTTAITIGNATATTTIAGNTSVTLNATTATGMVCRNTGNGVLSACDATFLTPTASNFILNTTTQQASSNFNVSGTGQVGTALITPSIRAVSDSTSAIKLQNSAGTVTALTVDTTNNRVGIGTATTPATTLHVGVNDSSATNTVALLEQQGSGNTTLQLKNSSEAWNVGIDSSDSNSFKITTAATAAVTTTFGNSTSGDTNDTGDNNGLEAGRYTANTTGNVVSLSVNVACSISAAPNNQFRMAIYTDNGSNTAPSTLLAQSATGTLVSGWNQLSIPTTAVTSGTVYWIVYNTNGTSNTSNCYRYTSGVGAYSVAWVDAYGFTSLPSTWPGSSGNGTASPNFYATVQSSAATNTYTNSLFQMTDTGRLTLHNSLDSTSAFQIQNAAGTSVMNIDTTNSKVLIAGTLDTTTAAALTIGNTTATSISIGKSTINTTLASRTINVGTSGGTTNILGATQTTNNTAGNAMIIRGSSGLGSGNGGTVTLQGGNAGATSGANGGNLVLAGGTGSGTGVGGLVVINSAAYSTSTVQASATSVNITQANIDSFGAIILNATAASVNFTLSSPTLGANAAGRVIYVTAANGSSDFTLRANVGGGTGVEQNIAMRMNTTATMIWNGSQWTAAGASSSTTLQSAYDNTLQSAGGAELIVSKTSATNGLTIRDSSTASVNGALLTVQSSSAANLFSVNSNVTEYSSNSGAESYAVGNTAAFPASTWVLLNGATVSRNTATANIATGQGSAQVVTSTTASSGVKNVLSTSLTAGQHYNVSFTAKLSTGTFTDLAVYYSIDGTTTVGSMTQCTTANQAIKTSVWTKVNCAFTAPSTGITAANSINVIQVGSGTAHTFFVDNISVTIAADYNYATDPGVDNVANFSTNWSAAGTSTVTQDLSDGNDASSSAQASTSTANSGVRNKLSINPLASTLYRVSVYTKLSSGAALNDFKVRYTPDGGTSYIDCVDYNTQTVTSGWTQITCYITTGATSVSNPYVYFLQTTASGTRVFLVDTFSMTLASSSTPNVQVGSGINGGPTTLFTLDKGASAPIAANNDSLLGSMYYDTTLGKLQCYEADGWGACGSSPDNIITISPEYTNAVLHGTGIGTMTSDICSDYLDINDGTSGQPTICGTNETYNFYKWTSPQATAQYYSIYVTYQLPGTFKSFNSGQTSLMGRTDNTNSSVTYQVYRSDSSGLAPCGSAITASSGVQTSWQTATATGAADPSTCSFTAGSSIVFKITVMASQNANAYVGNLNFAFSNK